MGYRLYFLLAVARPFTLQRQVSRGFDSITQTEDPFNKLQ